MAKASIVFGALALLLLATSLIWFGGLFYVSIVVAIIGAILGAMPRAMKQRKTGLILNLVLLFIAALGFIVFAPHPAVAVHGDSAVATPGAQ
jgi:hypothetical protein